MEKKHNNIGRIRRISLIGPIGLICLIGLIGGAKTAEASALQKQANNLGLVAYYPMNENTGTTAGDFSGKGNSGTLTNGPTWTTGKTGTALNFDGTDDYVSFSSLPAAGPYTVSYWVKFTSPLADFQYIVTGYGDSVAFGNTYGKFGFWDWDLGANSEYYESTTTAQVDRWYFFTGTDDGATTRLYINGVQENTGTHKGYMLSGQGYLAKSLSFDDRLLKGTLDDVRIYNRALGATEIATLYNQTSQSKIKNSSRGLVAYYPMSEGAGTVTADATGQGNNGTLVNTPTWGSGKFGKGLTFDGTDDSVNTPALNLTTNKITFSAWVYPTGSQVAYTGIVYSRDPSQAVGMHYSGNTTSLTYTWNDNSALTYSWNSNLNIPQNEWSFISIAIEPTKATAYMCTASGGCQSAVNAIAHIDQLLDTNFHIGWDENSIARHFLGKIDDVRIYNRALTQTEITNLYQSSGEALGIINASQNTQLTNGLVGMWDFTGARMTATTVADASGNNNTGTLTGATGSQNKPQRAIGAIGQALKFDGTDDYVNLGDISTVDFGSGDYAFSAWIKPASITAGQVISKDGDAGSERQFVGMALASGNLNAVLFYNSTPMYTWYNTTDAPITANVWQHVIVQRHGNTFESYINGVAHTMTLNGASTADFPQTMQATTANLTIGERVNATHEYFNGLIDDVRVYSRALSADEVRQLYNQGK